MAAILFWPPYVNSLWFSDATFRHKAGSTLAQVMACCRMAPSHYLSQRWLLINKVLWRLPKTKFTGSDQNTDLQNEFEKYVCKIISTPLRGQWVKKNKLLFLWITVPKGFSHGGHVSGNQAMPAHTCLGLPGHYHKSSSECSNENARITDTLGSDHLIPFKLEHQLNDHADYYLAGWIDYIIGIYLINFVTLLLILWGALL